ncbi:hypothetical protein EON65_04455 [archaeon]|nr:MAG: hypothetical protein EON65_04455 [archaeon]
MCATRHYLYCVCTEHRPSRKFFFLMMDESRWHNLNQFLCRPSQFGNESGQLPNGYYEPGSHLLSKLRKEVRVLVVGAGGLGCEILKVCRE